MNKVITLNLNGNAYQLEESGYEALRAYLETAARRLEGNPDKDEIIADIEQAIADKFRGVLGTHKTVVVTKEVEQIITEMGPVEDATPDEAKTSATAAGPGAAGAGETAAAGAGPATSARRLYKISEGAMLGGVCNGLAVYTNIDVTVIRVLFAILTVFTYGSGILVYLLLMLLLPAAETSAEKAAAYGGPSTAQEYIRRAKEGYYDGMKTFHDKRAYREWRRKFKRDMRGWSRDFRHDVHATAHQMGENWHRHWSQPSPPGPGSWVALPFLNLAKVLITLVWIYASISLVASGTVFGLALPAEIPVWVGLIFLFVLFRFIVWPLRAARHAFYFRAGYWPRHCGSGGFLDSFIAVGMLAVLVWAADRYVPSAHEALQNLPPAMHHAVDSLREWWAKR
jgi:phage shock protein PspC (stress-responsive transcriptional regulator)